MHYAATAQRMSAKMEPMRMAGTIRLDKPRRISPPMSPKIEPFFCCSMVTRIPRTVKKFNTSEDEAAGGDGGEDEEGEGEVHKNSFVTLSSRIMDNLKKSTHG